MRFLIIDDDAELLASLSYVLQKEGYFVDQAKNFKEGFYFASTKKYDALILDVNLPDGNGLNLCQILRDNDIICPILVLSANSDVGNKVHGLQIGADDYLTKPFSTEELLARLKSLIRRFSTNLYKAYQIEDYKFDPNLNEITNGKVKIHLTKTESSVLELLLRFQGQAVSRDEMLENIYGDEYPLNNSIDVIVNRLRKKLKSSLKIKINNVRGIGYTLSQ